MKVEVNENKVEQEQKFPCLMKSDYGSIILAFEIKPNGHIRGCYLNNYDPTYPDEFRLSAFKPFNGTITLSND